ncbi:hypothetical protein [Streptomyces sp. NPDC051218]|uniref:hypothetical protein n=1 Tax=Streptomyces sp. NPDC051218 TaxID=3365645 RepID=UPI0037A06956
MRLRRAEEIGAYVVQMYAHVLAGGLGGAVAEGVPAAVDTVLVVGRVIKRNGALVGADLPAPRRRLIESRNRIAEAAGVQLDGTRDPKV